MKSVLIVDDEPTVRKVLTDMLSESEFQPLEANSASDALLILRKAAPKIAVVVTDVSMPGILNGLDLAKFTQNSWPQIKVIVTTGFADEVRKELPQNVRFLPKPWKPDEMMNRILYAATDFEAVQNIGRISAGHAWSCRPRSAGAGWLGR